MALTGSDQITITDIRDSISCEISSSNGTSLLDASQGTVLTCRLYGAEGEIDPEVETEEDEEDITQDYVYYWTKKETSSSEEEKDEEEEEFFRTGKSIELTPEDLESSDNNNSFTFYCDVYSIFLEEDGQLVAHGEITLDSTIKKWMEFDDTTGLWVYGNGDESNNFCTLTDNEGFHVYKQITSTSAEISETKNSPIASFSNLAIIDELKIGKKLSMFTSSQGGILFGENYNAYTEKIGVNIEQLDESLLVNEDTDMSIQIDLYYLEINISDTSIIGDDNNTYYVYTPDNSTLHYNYKIKKERNDTNAITSSNVQFYLSCLVGTQQIFNKISISSPYNGNSNIDLTNYTSIFLPGEDSEKTITFVLINDNDIIYDSIDFLIKTNFSS